NAGAPNQITNDRSALIFVTGQNSSTSQIFRVDQTGCVFPTSTFGETFGSAPQSGAVNVNTGGGCPWNVANVPAWATTTSGGTGTGPGAWQFTVAANAGATRTSTSLTVAGQPFTLTQLAVPVKTTMPGSRSRFSLADSSAEHWESMEMVGNRSYCGRLAPAPGATDAAAP